VHSTPLTVERALELAGIADLASRKIKTLSGGQRQRVLSRWRSCPTLT
jgi:ABC-type Mn2+/Zn2+ transport system ATPase subunit